MKEKYRHILDRIDAACARAGRKSQEVSLIAVSKGQSADRMNELAECVSSSGGQVIFGESYLQEYLEKLPQLHPGYMAHMIGPLQSNKVKDSVKLFDMIESLHSEKTAALMQKEAAKLGKLQKVLVQVNVSDDPAKKGFAREKLHDFISFSLDNYPHLQICGLMTITWNYEDPEATRPDFRTMKGLLQRMREAFPKLEAEQNLELSMGMSADFEIAIEEGATMVRVGSALFGERE